MTQPEEIEYARVRNIPGRPRRRAPTAPIKICGAALSQCGVLEDPWTEPPDDIYTLTKSPADAPDVPRLCRDRVAERRAGRGQRRRDAARRAHRLASRRSRACMALAVSTWSRTALSAASRARSTKRPRRSCSTPRTASSRDWSFRRDLQRLKQRLSQEYADIVYNGLWFSPTRSADRRVRAAHSAAGHRHGPAQALQGRLPGRRAQIAVHAPRSGPGDLRRGRHAFDQPPRRRQACAPVVASSRWQISGQDDSAASPMPTAFQFGSSFRFDKRLFEDDVTGSLAWVEALDEASACFSRARSGNRLGRAQRHSRSWPARRRRSLTARTRTCTPSSSGSSSSASAISASACTPAGRATSRSRSICASI